MIWRRRKNCLALITSIAAVRTIGQASGSEGLAMLQFAIRDVLWLIALAAVGSAWYADHKTFDERRAATRRHAEKLRSSLDAAKGINGMLHYAIAHPDQGQCWQVPYPNWELINKPIP
jgi:hypothetical protein